MSTPFQFGFQCSSASRKFLNPRPLDEHPWRPALVSVLFSEPKIPQCEAAGVTHPAKAAFQCSSASRKFLNNPDAFTTIALSGRFSALQRAENSSMMRMCWRCSTLKKFQCSSASRKFLNTTRPTPPRLTRAFQCSSASRKFLNDERVCPICGALQFQCSSASRKFLNFAPDRTRRVRVRRVSVLFSEPKIPQSGK